jgi:hypothetical protein
MLAQQKKRDRWKLRPEAGLIFALEDLDLTFYPEEAEKATKLWQYGWHIADISKQLNNRNQDELAVLFMHLARQGKIQKRQNGVFGA